MNNNPETGRSKLARYEDLFFGLKADALPDFHFLHNIKVSSQGPDEELSEELRSLIVQQLSPVYTVCQKLDFRPLSLEFALITDTRLVGPRTEPFFSAYLTFFLQPVRALRRAYQDALRFMATGEAGEEQIVPHKELFAANTAFVKVDCAELSSVSPTGPPCEISVSPLDLTAVRQGFVLIENPQLGLITQIEKFIGKFFANLEADPDLADAAREFRRSTFLLLPFVRPAFESSALVLSPDSDRSHYRGYPGGAVFLFLRRSTDDADLEKLALEKLARALSWLLAEASLRESYASFHLEESRKRAFISYTLTHPLKHRLGALYSNTEWLKKSYDQNDGDFEARFAVHRELVDAVYCFAELVHTLHYAAVHGAERTLSAHNADGSLKFSTVGTLDLRKILTEAESNLALSPVIRTLELAYADGFKPVVDGFLPVEATGEIVRLNEKLYREMIYELVSNVLNHNLIEEELARAQVGIESVHDRVALVITNAVDERPAQQRLGDPVNQWEEWHSESPTGLTFIADLLLLTEAGTLYYKHPRNADGTSRIFSAALALKGLSQ